MASIRVHLPEGVCGRWLLPLLMLPLFPTSVVGAGPGHEKWYKYDHEHAYVEMLILIVLVSLAIVFESVWHRAMHSSVHAYRYGDTTELVDISRGGKASAHNVRSTHLQLSRELVTRAGGEFMTLGFLAFCVFVFNTCGGFMWLPSKLSSEGIHWPLTEHDWVHTVELVHMQLFIAMGFYFILISRIVSGSMERIRIWELLDVRRQNRHVLTRQNNEVVRIIPSSVVQAIDHHVKDYSHWRRFFISKLHRWQHARPMVFNEILMLLGIDRNAENVLERFHDALEKHFVFSDYLALNVEYGVCDSIQVHRNTWFCLIFLFGIFALMHRFGHISLLQLTPVFIGMIVVALVIMWFVSKRRQDIIVHSSLSADDSISASSCSRVKKSKIAGMPTISSNAVEILQEAASRGKPTTSNPQASKQVVDAQGENSIALASSAVSIDVQPKSQIMTKRRMNFNERFETELLALRYLQMFLFLFSYAIARTLLDVEDWETSPLLILFYSTLVGLLFAMLMYFLPTQVPVFLGVMALPPFMDDINLAAFVEVLEHGLAKDECGSPESSPKAHKACTAPEACPPVPSERSEIGLAVGFTDGGK
mmetsp:Transcript_76740/g.155852  ORF Transcript_76740/g.155852 Transcript_76740/m.155852 type:complete len:592 (+) Transcript_76740:33-1808(+)